MTAGPTRRSRRSSGCSASIPSRRARAWPTARALVRARRYREASEQWESLVRSDPSSPLAAAARNQLRSTRDLVHIFTAKAG